MMHSQAPRVTAVVTYFPIPQDQGDPVRVLMMLEVLAQISKLRVVVVKRVDTSDNDIVQLKARLGEIDVSIHEPTYAAQSSKTSRGLHAIARGVPPWTLSQWSDSATRAVTDFSLESDLTVLIGEAAGLYVRYAAGAVVWDKANVLTASNARNIFSYRSPLQILKSVVSALLGYRYERAALRVSDAVWVTSTDECARLQRWFGRAADAVIRSVVDLPTSRTSRENTGQDVAWLGSFRYPPNWDGLVRTLRGSGPAFIRAGVRLKVIGFGATPTQIETLEQFSFIDYVGFAPDLQDVVQDAGVAIVPVWAGAGVKLKTLTLIGLDLPLIATPAALEGLDSSVALDVVSRPRDFGPAVERAFTHRNRWGEAASRARAYVHEHVSRDAFTRDVSSAIFRALEGRTRR